MESTMESSSAKREETKGKAIMEEGKGEEAERLASPTGSVPMAEMNCGICLCDVGRSIRGRIDSCDHHFCFVCIMEWAKVETRCPLCKQRFRAIRRPAVHGIFARERVVDLPERNQVYSPFGNESTILSDPYANIMCGECQTATNEELLLLCDLCDSASHTYCVGLGATVPEGDWYCRDCAKVRDEHSRTQSDSDGCNQDSYNSLRALQASQTRALEPQIPVTISEIVSDRIVSNSSEGFSSEALELQNIRQLRRNTTQKDSKDRVFSNRETAPSSEASGEQHVRTLRQCRNLQGRIRQIRENWNVLRSGSLTFSSSFINSSNRDYNNKRKNRVISGISREPESISSLGVSKESAVASVSSETSHNSELQDVSKAWKMMEVAKSMEGNRKSTVPNLSSNLSGKINSSKDVRDHNPSSFVSKGYNPPLVLAGRTTFKSIDKQQKCPVHEKAYIKKEMEVVKHFHGGPIKLPRLDIMETSSYKVDRISAQESICCRKKATLKQVVDEELTVSKGYDAPNCRDSAAYSLSGQFSLLSNKPIVSSCGIVNSHNEKNTAVSSADKGYVNMNCSAKDEVQTLVKLNLKLQSKNQSLDANRFKEVARVATHTILAACGLEHSKTSVRMISGPTCKHPEQFRELRKSNLMPDSCRECFYSYVKHVVNSIFLEKTAPQKHAI